MINFILLLIIFYLHVKKKVFKKYSIITKKIIRKWLLILYNFFNYLIESK